MCGTALHNEITVNSRNYDPTRTTVLRNIFAGKMTQRFRELITVIRKAIVVEDCFGLQDNKLFTFQMITPGYRAFAFPLSAQKIDAFMEWLQQQIDKGILETTQIPQIGEAIKQPWTNTYIEDSYKRGVLRARYEMKKAGFDVPSIDATGGIEMSMSTPFHIDRLGVLYGRAFSGLKGITTAMDTQISRILAQGIADGDGPILLSRKLVATINGSGMGDLAISDSIGRFIPAFRRAKMLARTEIIRAHHQAMIQEYENWRVEGVIVQAEWMTAGDNRVCSICESLQGNGPLQGGAYPLEMIRNMIPRHPQCRCIALPYYKNIIK